MLMCSRGKKFYLYDEIILIVFCFCFCFFSRKEFCWIPLMVSRMMLRTFLRLLSTQMERWEPYPLRVYCRPISTERMSSYPKPRSPSASTTCPDTRISPFSCQVQRSPAYRTHRWKVPTGQGGTSASSTPQSGHHSTTSPTSDCSPRSLRQRKMRRRWRKMKKNAVYNQQPKNSNQKPVGNFYAEAQVCMITQHLLSVESWRIQFLFHFPLVLCG